MSCFHYYNLLLSKRNELASTTYILTKNFFIEITRFCNSSADVRGYISNIVVCGTVHDTVEKQRSGSFKYISTSQGNSGYIMQHKFNWKGIKP